MSVLKILWMAYNQSTNLWSVGDKCCVVAKSVVNSAININAFGNDMLIINFSIWQGVTKLKNFVYKTCT